MIYPWTWVFSSLCLPSPVCDQLQSGCRFVSTRWSILRARCIALRSRVTHARELLEGLSISDLCTLLKCRKHPWSQHLRSSSTSERERQISSETRKTYWISRRRRGTDSSPQSCLAQLSVVAKTSRRTAASRLGSASEWDKWHWTQEEPCPPSHALAPWLWRLSVCSRQQLVVCREELLEWSEHQAQTRRHFAQR